MEQRPNDKCACGSGLKFKRCCVNQGYSNSVHERRRTAEAEARRTSAPSDEMMTRCIASSGMARILGIMVATSMLRR